MWMEGEFSTACCYIEIEDPWPQSQREERVNLKTELWFEKCSWLLKRVLGNTVL